MMKTTALLLALIGDYNPDVIAHQAIPIALQQAAEALGLTVHTHWLDTDTLTSTTELQRFDGFWCVPASPYRDTDGALRAIRFAREQRRPFLGTCGGFQHAVLEYARNVLGWADAEHGELAPDARRAVIVPLSCALVEATDTVRLSPYTRIAEAYASLEIEEGYRCRYGLNREFADALLEHALIPCGHDSAGDLRAVELLDHPFFVATLFQPERAALKGITPPLAIALLNACREVSA
ncbi:Glutamine amidotransferase class-I [Pseudomonas extremaustralis]|jgi:CTP synthase (UTP-ammonia lyase)|uniref:CTP synthase (glutamine hydrolyzing) n=2 Tax=Pseudomonas extremaustralis TaxID=359110 RepID=A0ABY0P161_9PSED|nr:Glutamine amidotransferase class-I [Pseudomonas extremaustralis]